MDAVGMICNQDRLGSSQEGLTLINEQMNEMIRLDFSYLQLNCQ